MPSARTPRAPEPTIALFEPLRLVRLAVALWPELKAETLWRALPPAAAEAGDLDRQVPLRAVFEILAELARVVRDPRLPLTLAQGTRIDEMGVVGFAIMTAATGRAALLRTMRFQRLISAAGSWQLTERDGEARLSWQRALPLDLGHRLANEIVFAQIVCYARALLGAFSPIALSFRHPAPGPSPAHASFFGCPVHFGAERDEVILSSAVLDRVPISANEALAHYFDQLITARASDTGESELRGQVMELVAAQLPDGEPEPSAVAHRLGMALRTLQTRLREQGTTFRALVDEVRRTRAEQLLARGESVTSAAFALGFSETSAFSRAFRRWHGRSPRALRAESTRSRAASSR